MEGITETRRQIPVKSTTNVTILRKLILPKSILEGIGEKVYYLPLNRFRLDGMKWLYLQSMVICPIEQMELYLIEDKVGTIPYILPPFIACLVPLDRETPRQAIDRLLAFLKLFKDELPHIDCCLIPPNESKILFHYNLWERKMIQDPFVLKKSEKRSFKNAWIKYGKHQSKSFAITRFIGADFEPYDYDMAMYLIEALESLLCVGGRGETTFKFSSRGTIILGQKLSINGKKDLMGKLKKAYDYRSRLTHGENPKFPFEGFLSFLREKTRECICFFREYDALSDAKKRNEIIEDMTIYNVKTISPKRYISV